MFINWPAVWLMLLFLEMADAVIRAITKLAKGQYVGSAAALCYAASLFYLTYHYCLAHRASLSL